MKKKFTQISLALFLAVGTMATLSSCGGEKTEEASEEGKKCEEGKCEEGKCEEGKKCEDGKKCEAGADSTAH
jgi:hypothetical protein